MSTTKQRRRIRFDRQTIVGRMIDSNPDADKLSDADLKAAYTLATGQKFVEPHPPKYAVGDQVTTKRPILYREGKKTYALEPGAKWTVEEVRVPDEGLSGRPRYLIGIGWRKKVVTEGRIRAKVA